MQENSTKILLAEYDRLKELEQSRLENYERSLQLYLTVISVAAGVLVFLLDRQAPLGSSSLSINLLLGLVLVIGEITFLRLLGIDMAIIENARAYLLIRNKFLQEDRQLGNVFLKGMVQDSKRYRSWASIGGIIERAWTVAQSKTTVVFINCIVSTSMVVVAVWPQTIWIGLTVGIPVIVVIGFLHVVYAYWRYKKAVEILSTGETGGWI